MKTAKTPILLLALATALAAGVLALAVSSNGAPAATAVPKAPAGFFGVAPQTALTPQDAAYMKAGGVDIVRWPLIWPSIQPTAKGGYNWAPFDETITAAADAGLRILPALASTPPWLARKETTLPINNARQRAAWTAFLEAAVRRYGPGGEFWRQTGGVGVNYEPQPPTPSRVLPIREWQIWNEPNFFYFTYPVSPSQFGKFVTLSSKAIKGVQRSAKVVLGGLFGEPTAGGKRGMPAADFLDALYRVPGIKSRFDGVALHPYAVDAETLAELAEEMREVVLDNRDRRTGLYITEMGWGSQNNFQQVAFEQGIRGQVRQLRDSYSYLLANRRQLNLKGTYWFSWKDVPGSCSFCDSVGLFRAGPRFKPKPSWREFVRIAGGQARP